MKTLLAWWLSWYAGRAENATTNHRREQRRCWIGQRLAKVDGDSTTGDGATGYDDDDDGDNDGDDDGDGATGTKSTMMATTTTMATARLATA